MSKLSSKVAARYLGEGDPKVPSAHRKTAAFPPFPPKGEEGTTTVARNIPKGHDFNKKALKPLAKALFASSISLGHALTAYRHISRLKSVTVSPDGKLGGQGYVMDLGEMRKKLFEVSEGLSAIADTLYDELQAPHWKPKLAQLDEDDQNDVNRFIEEAEDVMENPEGEAEEDIEEIENKTTKPEPPKGEGMDASGIPQADASQPESADKAETVKTASEPQDPHSVQAIWRTVFADMQSNKKYPIDLHTEYPISKLVLPKKSQAAKEATQKFFANTANSSLPVSVEPGGPRVDHIGPGTGDGEYGNFVNKNEEPAPPDNWDADGGGLSRRDDEGEDYDYPSAWENQMSLSAESLYPDAYSDDTPTEAWDFGLGFGAKGQGAGGYANPSGEGGGSKGVEGPATMLPGTPDESSGDSSTLLIDDKLNPRHASEQELVEALYGVAQLPNAKPVSRSDYYVGPKDNMVSMGQSELPVSERVDGVGGQPLIDTNDTIEDMNTPYVRYDYTTKTLREPSGQHPGQNHQEPWAPDGESTR